MRAVIQRVSRASVTIDENVKSFINKGLLVLLGIEGADGQEDIQWLSNKITQLRVFNDDNNVMNRSVKDIDGEILVISQFTLYAKTKKGNRPSYIRAAKPEISVPRYKAFVEQLSKDLGKEVQTGEFGAHMDVELVNDGPVTILIDTKNKE
ncbi:D-aminoacyl-tRNA deacylase [Prolixibacter sp. SD074]|jgi:D-tyrosyl-tRNA(Tyr) deacylase|uniref:D-aminoacyl-tRNA deacylase n=1 Tax=Prolixibacter sp. SD074 TaxID=2652391 RepID=UPI0012783FFB|nr:D-aminoacyl-tRNA deacylase [Prolixibacter sp. SD074]GET30453.1 D-aminoacyl-tRNA deacylase [Prolixibacter sp. SD074]